MFRKAKTLRDPDSLRSFIYSFAVRVLKAELRRRKLRGWMPFMPEAPLDFGFLTVDVEARDLLRKLYALLDRLSPRDRLAYVLRRMEAMTVEEIAATMDISISTVKRAIAHASARLSRWIDADPGLAGLRKERAGRERVTSAAIPTIPKTLPALAALTELGRDAVEPHTQAELDDGFPRAPKTRRRRAGAPPCARRRDRAGSGRGVCRARAPGCRGPRPARGQRRSRRWPSPGSRAATCWKADICPSRAARASP